MGSSQNATNPKNFIGVWVLAFSVLFLTACSAQPEAIGKSSGTTAPSVSVSGEAPGPTPLAISPTLKSSPVSFSCEQLIPLQALYDFNPNYALDSSRSPRDGSPEKQIQDLRGLVCIFVNLSTGDEIQIAVAQLDPSGIKEVTAKLEKTDPPTTSFTQSAEAKSFFSVTQGIGVAQVVTSKYWIVCSSTSLTTAEDLAPLVDAAIVNSANF
jgi:hypothetical protein